MKRPKPKLRMVQFSNKNRGPGRDQGEKEAAKRRKAIARQSKYPMPNEQPDEQVRELAIIITEEVGGVWDIEHADDAARFILAREKKLREALEHILDNIVVETRLTKTVLLDEFQLTLINQALSTHNTKEDGK